MAEEYNYLKPYMWSQYPEDTIIKVGKDNVFYPTPSGELEDSEIRIGRPFPSQLRDFYIKIGWGHLTTPHNKTEEYDTSTTNLILPPNAAACFYNGKLCDDSEEYYMSESSYEMLQPGDLPFFEISDSCNYFVMKLDSDNPNAVWFMGFEKIEDSFEQFIWNLYYKSPTYYSENW